MQDKSILEKFSTPFYVFDIDVLHSRIKYLQKKLGDLNLCYAVKANPFIINEVEPLVERLEICSEGEYDICEKLNVPKHKMVISGVNKNPEFIESLIIKSNECIFTVESLNQFKLLKELSEKYNKTLKIMPRLTSGNQFGISEKEIIDIVKEVIDNKNLEISGIEYFSGTQKYSLKKIERELEHIKNVFDSIKENCHYDIEELEYGSGFPVEYFGEHEFNEDEFLESFTNLMKNYFKGVKIIIETGRSIASSSGKYYTKVVDAKENSIGKFAIVDGGINHLVYYGQTMAMKYPEFELFPLRENDSIENWNICGSLCTVNDILIKQLPLSNLKINDCFIFKNTGAYCMCEGIALLLSRDLPKIIIKKGETLKVVREDFKTSVLNTPKV